MRTPTDFDKNKASSLPKDIAATIFSQIKQHSFARVNKFIVDFTLPEKVAEYIKQRDSSLETERLKKIKLNCYRISVPSKSLSKLDNSNSAHEGIIATSGNLDNMFSLSFICSGDLKEKVLMDYWVDYIYDFDSRQVKFLDDYSTTFYFTQLDAHHTAVYGLIIENSYPSTIQPVMYDYQNTNTPVSLELNFTFSYLRNYNYKPEL